jgi:hypothetical protein
MNWGDSHAAAETRIAPNYSFDELPKKSSVPSRPFYANYHGHKLHFLHTIVRKLRGTGRSIVFFAGDSSLGKHFVG